MGDEVSQQLVSGACKFSTFGGFRENFRFFLVYRLRRRVYVVRSKNFISLTGGGRGEEVSLHYL